MILADDICDLVQLRALVLSLEQLSGTIPKCIGKLASLEILSLHPLTPTSRTVTYRLVGEVPSSIWQLGRLKVLRILNSLLSGFETPPVANAFPHLESLRLSWNPNLVGDVTAILQTSTKLESLDLSASVLSFRPGSLRSLSSLTFLNLDSSMIEWEIEEDFWRTHPALRVFSAQSAYALSGSIGHDVGSMRNLTTLSVSTTNLSGTIPPSIVNCPLETLTVGWTRMSPPLPSNLGDLNMTLSYLDFAHLKGRATALPESVGVLHRLKSLSLSESGFIGTFPSGLENALNLTTLRLDNNDFVGPLPSLAMTGGEVSYSSEGNHFSGTIPPSVAMRASYLNLAYNELEGEIPPLLFNFTRSVQYTQVDLSNNRFSGCLPLFPGRSPLFVNLAYNNFSCEVPSMYIKIARLTISRNRLTGNLSSLFSVNTHGLSFAPLVELHAEYNQLEGTIPNLDNPFFPSLRSLGLGNNRLSGTLPAVPPALHTLNLSGNKFTHLWPNVTAAIANLKILDLSQNSMTLHNVTFVDLIAPDMTYLSLAHNTFTSAPSYNGPSYPSLVLLDLTNTSLTGYFPVERFPGISVLKLARNLVKGGMHLEKVKNTLTQLDISQNKFFFNVNQLSVLTALTNVDASQNDIYGAMKLAELSSLQTVNLANNIINHPLDLVSLGVRFSTGRIQLLNISNNPQLPKIRELDTSATGLNRTSTSAPSLNFRDSVICYELAFFNGSGKSFIFDEDLFNYQQCDCNHNHFGLPPSKCLKCPSGGTESCGATQATMSDNYYTFAYDKTSRNHSTTPQSSHQNLISSIWTSLTDSFTLGTRDEPSNVNDNAFDTLGLETESCLVTTIQTLSSSSNCRGVRISSSDLGGHNVSIANLLLPQCADGSDGRLCSRCICDVGKGGSCWFSSGPKCSKCRHVFSLSTSLPLAMGLVTITIVVGGIVLGIVLHRRRRQSLVPFVDLPLPKRIFYRVMHLTTLGNLSIVVTFLQMLIGVTQWDAYARVEIFGILNGGSEGYAI